MLYRYQKTLQEIYNEYLEKHQKNGIKPYPDKLLALLLLQEKDNYKPEQLVNEMFYKKYQHQIDEKINKVINDFHLTKEDIINFIEQKGILYREETYEHDKIWFVFSEGFSVVIGAMRWNPTQSPEQVYTEALECFHGEYRKEKTNTRKRTKEKYKEQVRLRKIRRKNGYKHN